MPSELPPLPETGNGSTNSSIASAVQEAMERSAKVMFLGKMAAVDSLDRNLCIEDAEAKRYGEQFENADVPCGSPDKEDEPMRILAAGNVTVHQNEPAINPDTPATPIPPTAKKHASTFAKVALGSALLASGVGLGAGIPLIIGAFDKADATPAPPAASGYEYLGRVFEPEELVPSDK